ncbi:MAG TPA: selenide, water dikinase SelD [Candidatus Eisenbacteria bacterium]
MGPADLRHALDLLRQPPRDKRVLVDASTLDDAGVFAHGRGEALVQTVDFFPPIVDDPYDFGRIAAANSLSDVYAMGGRPLTALALLCVPDRGLPAEAVAAVLQGGLDTMRRAGVSVVGGHTVRDPELKFGYAVTGIARRNRLLRNSGARAGDRVFLTKPLGTGILSTALKQGKLDPASTRRLTAHMAALNRAAAEAAVAARARAATDVTGFGLLGHATQLAQASGVTLALAPTPRWFLPRVLELVEAGVAPGGLARNRDFYAPEVDAGGLPAPMRDALFDPQTSGGLLVCVPARAAATFKAALERRRVWHVAAGEVRPRGARAVELARR